MRGVAIDFPLGAGPSLLCASHETLGRRTSVATSVGSRRFCDANNANQRSVCSFSGAAHCTPDANGAIVGEAAGLDSGGRISAVLLCNLTGEGLSFLLDS